MFIGDRMRQDATLRKLEVIGQAVKNLSGDTKSREPDVPWTQIAGMRDKVIHDYFGGWTLKVTTSTPRPRILPDRAGSAALIGIGADQWHTA
jgi:uncharacterized protein with HEPN domain